jgi:hypothetical protein
MAPARPYALAMVSDHPGGRRPPVLPGWAVGAAANVALFLPLGFLAYRLVATATWSRPSADVR